MMTSPSNFDEYDEIVNFIDLNMPEYNDGALSFPEIIEDLYKRINKLAEENAEMYVQLYQPCGHPLSAIVATGEGTNYCGSCADDSLRANIAAGVEA